MSTGPVPPLSAATVVGDDLFVSYAHADDEAPAGVERGWVSTFVGELQKVLRRKLGGAGASVWMDHRLASNQPVTAELVQRVSACRVLLLVLSPGYLRSEWCQRELATFMARAQARGDGGSVFPIEIEPSDRAAWPAPLQSLTPTPFWRQEPDELSPRLLGFPRPRLDEDSPYWRQVTDLAHRIAAQLRARPDPGTARLPVLVAECTDDLEDERARVLSSLGQRGDVVLLPAADYARANEADFRAAVRSDLDSAALFVQLLGPHAGRRAPGSTHSFVALQALEAWAALAAPQAARRPRPLQLLQWHPPGIDLDRVADPQLRELLAAPAVARLGFEEFRQSVLRAVDALRRDALAAAVPAALSAVVPPLPAPPGLAGAATGAQGLSLYLQAAPEDRDTADHIADRLAAAGASVHLSPDPSPGQSFLQGLMAQEDALRLCDGVLLVYGLSPVASISAAFQYAVRVFGVRRTGVWSAVLDLPPADKPRVPIRSPNLVTIACRDGFDPDLLGGFFDRLRHAGGAAHA